MAENTACPSGMVSWWKGEGDATDSTGTNHGILVNNVAFSPGVVGAAFDFDAGYLRVPHAAELNFSGSFTIEAWIYPRQDGLNQIVAKWGHPAGRAYSFHTLPGMGLRFAISDDAHQLDVGFHAFDVAGVLALNQWNHVAAVYDHSSGSRLIYVNGVPVASRTDPPISLTNSDADLGIGAAFFAPETADLLFPGRIDEVSAYNRALTNVELLSIFQAGSIGKCQPVPTCSVGMVGWWPGNGDATDQVGTNDGALVNGATFAGGIVGQAFSFDGVDDHVDIGDDAQIFFADNEAFTLEAWFMPVSDTPSYFILKNAAYGIRWQGRGQPLLFFNGNNHYSNRTSWELGRWYHVAMVDDGSTSVSLYIDGVFDHADTGAARNPNRFACRPGFGYCFTLQFGAWNEPLACSGNCIEFFHGLVDEVTLYDRALGGAEIQAIFAAGSAGKCLAPDEDGDGISPPDDCDDSDSSIHPGGTEHYDAKDNDCDGAVDEDLDDDGDGIPNFYDVCTDTLAGDGVDSHGCSACLTDVDGDLDGFPLSVDCNDRDASIHPSAFEACNRTDDDCDGVVDEGYDRDGDGFTTCAQPVADCNDSSSAIKPGASELPGNIVDENCDGSLGACDPNAGWANHGEFVRCVAAECEQLVAAGVLSDLQCDVLVSQAAKASVAKQPKVRIREISTAGS